MSENDIKRPGPESDSMAEAEDQAQANGQDAVTETGEPDWRTRLEAVEQERDQLKDQLLRALAEVENTRRRAARDREDAAKYGISRFAQELLGVADNLRRALDAAPPEDQQSQEMQALVSGVAATERALLDAFARSEIHPVSPLGERFDPNLHEAMFEVPGSEHPPGTVAQVVTVGYTLHDRLLRPAMVGVAKAAPAGENEA